MSDLINLTTQDRILTIQMNRPDKKNALTLDMYTIMAGAMRAAQDDPDVRVILFTGAGGNFTSGNDLGDFMTSPPVGKDSPVWHFLSALFEAKKPLVSAVTGVAVGIGTTMLLHCDLAYAGESARFILPFINLGLVPEAGSSFLLPRFLGHVRAAELLMLGDSFDAAKALELGFVNQVVPDDAVEALARSKAAQLAAKPPAALRLTKAMLKEGHAEALAATVRKESPRFIERLNSAEAAEAFQAFMERRAPDFSRFE